ncbi:MAG TPA: 16S rRNA (adenine(1518)-N(6)/adenine(1519)-N(6))-dimethyltransferase RsmA [Chthoniobacteraceae bacterium]|nr:16S rRNA (adenine(1518)-N(6)/adenine(1519)-N(6))-dimethyltransferase RsmA [Chthoniobacteraceae bacterium]
MNRAAIQQTLAEIGTRPTRSLGQNFLHDEEVARWIVDQLQLQGNEHLVEIGPGLGALTEFALGKSRRLTLIEKDGRMADFLRQRFEEEPGLTILHEDALRFDNRLLFEHGPAKVLGNLPYYVSSQVLLQFGAEPSPVTRMVFTLQKEMAERLSAAPSTKEYGALTLLVGRRWKVEYVRTLPGSVFLPAPNVESGVITLSLREPGELPDCDDKLFTRLVKEGFSQRRKMLRKMLAHHDLDWSALCADLDIVETVRAEALSLKQWIALTRWVEAFRNPQVFARTAQDIHGERFDVVDENNEVTGQASRHKVHAQGLRHRAVHILVFNKHGDLFLQKRSHLKDSHPGSWDSSAAGHLNAGDGYEETAVRELQEELGISAPLTLFGTLPPSDATGQEFVQCFEAVHSGPFTWPRSEIESGAFFPVAMVERWIAARPGDFASCLLECFRLWKRSKEAASTGA